LYFHAFFEPGFVADEVDENGNIPADIEATAKKLYGIIHQRFIQTPQGIAAMV
jgi:hypothetical protein